MFFILFTFIFKRFRSLVQVETNKEKSILKYSNKIINSQL